MSNEQHIDLFADQHLRKELHNNAVGMLKCSQSADDAVQETYIKMMKYKQELETKGDWIALCKCILWRSAIDILRKKKLIQRTLDTYWESSKSKISATPHKRLEAKEELAEIEGWVAKNTDEVGQKIMRMRAEGYKYKEIAEQLGINIGSVTGRVSRIRQNLKFYVEQKENMQAKYQEIEKLLHQYWEANTSIEEEKVLEDFFTSSNVPSHLAKFIPVFEHSKGIRKKVKRQKVGKLLGVCTLFAAILFATYLCIPSINFSPSQNESVSMVQTTTDDSTEEVAFIHASADATMEIPHLLVKYQ